MQNVCEIIHGLEIIDWPVPVLMVLPGPRHSGARMRIDIVRRACRFLLARVDPHDAVEFVYGVRPDLDAANQATIGTIRHRCNAATLPVVCKSVVATCEGSRLIRTYLSQGEHRLSMGAPILESPRLTLSVPEEDHVVAQDPEGLCLIVASFLRWKDWPTI